jgi:OFA family oxalate/formate antiporter-like MFS transporter
MNAMVCPFFGKDDDYCDVGCGYISPHDVRMMVAFCNCRYGECTKYQELAVRFPGLAARPARRGPVLPPNPESPKTQPPGKPGRPLVRPFRVKWPLPYQLRYVSGINNRSYIPSKEVSPMAQQIVKNRGWTVALAGTGINLALGILYTWSIFKGAISDSIKAGGPFNWDPASINDPYAVACLVFAAAMILAGKLQDKFGPKITCIIGGLLVGAGFVWISQTSSYWAWVAGFGVLAGTGIGFGYSAATPPALKWFPPAKTGLIAGIVVSGFGLASVYIAPLATHLLGAYGLQKSMMFFGIAFAVVVSGLGLLISNPPAGFVPEGAGNSGARKNPAKTVVDVLPSKLFTDAKFYSLWVCYFIGAGAGLMVIGSAKGLAKASMGEMAFLVVAIMSVGNAAGRLVAGVVSDRFGRANTLTFMLVFQAALMFLAIPGLSGKGNPVFVALLVTFMVFNYGTNLSLFPSFAKDYWGMKNFGMNYGILFSAWGVGAFVLVRVAEMLKVKTGGFTTSFAVAGVMLLVGAMLSLSLRTRKAEVPVEVPATLPVEEEDLVLERAGR